VSSQQDRPVEKIFVILDPTRMMQPALEKAEWIAARNSSDIHLYCCTWDPDIAEDERAATIAVDKTTAWLDRMAIPSRNQQLTVTTEVDWNPDWREQIAAAASRSGADLIIKTATRHSQVRRKLMKTSDWTLLRNSVCPTLLVDSKQSTDPSVVLAAVKLKPDETHAVLNERVISMSHRLAGVLDADLHAVTVFKGEDIYFDRQRFADSCNLPRNRVHAVEGMPHRGLAEVTEKIGAGILVVGCAPKQSPERGIIIGDTAQRVIDEVHADIIVVPAS